MRNIEISKNKLKDIAKLKLKKYREQTGLYIAEGKKILEEMLDNGIEIQEICSLKDIFDNRINCPVYITDESGMKKIASTDSPCEVLIVAKIKKTDLDSFKKLNNLILVDSVSDAGNLGTIIRSAAAFGVEGIILYGNCVDLYSSKVIRSTAGNFFKIPVIQVSSAEELKNNFKNHLLIATALSKSNNISLKECSEIKTRIVMFGSEANGLSRELIQIADKNIKLEMKNDVESLNLGVCASIIMYELNN